jgi:hypothetical protein
MVNVSWFQVKGNMFVGLCFRVYSIGFRVSGFGFRI